MARPTLPARVTANSGRTAAPSCHPNPPERNRVTYRRTSVGSTHIRGHPQAWAACTHSPHACCRSGLALGLAAVCTLHGASGVVQRQTDDIGLRLRGRKRRPERQEDVLGTLVGVIGRDRVFLLLEAFGGMRIHVPRYAEKGSRIAEVIGQPAARALTERFGGGRVHVPQGKPWRARVYRERGWAYGKIAHALGTTETSVHRWLNEMGLTHQHNGAQPQPNAGASR